MVRRFYMARRGENIYKRKDGRWEGRYIESYDVLGKAKYRSVYGHTYTEIKQKLKANINIPKNRTVNFSLSDWAEQYIQEEKEILKISTYNIYKRYVTNHIKPFFKDMALRKISKELIQGFINSMQTLSASTVKGIYCVLKKILKKAYDNNFIDAIWVGVILPRNKKTIVNVFTKEEQKRIENSLNIQENPNEIGILICLYTGIRIGELCGLRWEDINFLKGTIIISRTAQRITIDNKSVVRELPPKSETSHRTIPMPTLLSEKLISFNKKKGYVIDTDSHITDPRTYQNQYRRILERAGVEYANFHTLRHTFSVRALEVGFDVKTLSEILGHADATITLKRYAHSLDEHKRLSMEKLSSMWT